MSMQPERQKLAAPQTMAPADRPVPQPAGPSADRMPATRTSKRTGLVLAALAVGCLAIGAVATGLVNIPGVNSNPGSPPVATLSTTNADQSPLASDERSRIGVNMIDLSQNLAKSMQLKTDRLDGVVITKVWPNTPAEQAGLLSGDIILAVDGIPVAGAAQFRTKIEYTPLNERLTLVLERGGATQSVSIGVARWCTVGVKNSDLCSSE